MRAVAVLLVILFHFGFDAFSGGFIGVDIFFVISGFLITRNIVQDIEKGSFSLSGFYYRRIRRLFPALLFTILITAVFATFLFSAEHLQRFAASAIFAVFSLSNVFFWSEAGYFDTASAFKPLLHFWSLAVEEQFYLVWPLMLLLFFRSHRSVIIAMSLLACGVISMVMAQWLLHIDPAAAFYLTPFRIMEFSLGAVCVWIPSRMIQPRFQNAYFIAALVVILICATIYTENTPFPGYNSLLPCFAAAVIIWCSECKVSQVILGNRAAIQLGLISYSLYLIHWPLWVFYDYWKKVSILTYQSLLVLLVAVCLAFLMHRYIERPFRLKSDSRHNISGTRFFAGMTTVALLIIVPALHAWSTGGWPWRAPNRLLTNIDLSPITCQRPGSGNYEVLCEIRAANDDHPRVLVIGDSHAAHLQVAMQYLANKYQIDVDFRTHRGCPPLIGTYRMYGDSKARIENSCRRMSLHWEEYVSSGEYDLVLLAARWMNLYEPVEYGGSEIRRDYLADQVDPKADLQSARVLFTERLRATVDKIHEAGAKAIVFSQMPLLARDINGCSDEPWFGGTRTPVEERCNGQVRYEEQMQRLAFTDLQVRSLNKPDTLPIIFSDLLCDRHARACSTMINKHGVYRDKHHLSDEGSFLIATQFEERFAKFLK